MRYPALSEVWRLNYFNRNRQKNSHVYHRKTIGSNGQSSRVLAKYRQVFPIALFPDDIIIEELRVVWFKRNGPLLDEVISIMATDIACVNASAGPLLGHIHIQSLTGGPEIFMEHLFRGHVYQARSLIEGIALSSREGLKVDTRELGEERRELENAGKVRYVN